nr:MULTISPECIES: TIR-like protein FxsC [unclassified Streptomyces]
MAPPVERPYFFLSYAHTPRVGAGGPDPDMWVERLYQDLCSHVMAMTDLPAGARPGFIDREIRSGEGWPEQLSEALSTCRVFVPLFSPRYFTSEMCGKEWYAFAQRAVYAQARDGSVADAIVPALWVPVPPEQLPDPAQRLQYLHSDFGERYARDGLFGLIKLRVFAEEYERAVYELAKRIVSVADTSPLGPGRPVDYGSIPNAFGTTGAPRSVRIMVAAPTWDNLPAGRSPDSYGTRALDWNPYHPEFVGPLAHVAADLLRSQNYRTDISSFDEVSVPGESGRLPAGPEILLLDRWALRDEEQRERLAAFDAEHRPWAHVVVPWNRGDGQSRAAEAELSRLLEQTMPRKVGEGHAASRSAARGVPSMEEFGRVLPYVVEAAAQQYLRHASVYPPAGPQQRRPSTMPMQPDHGRDHEEEQPPRRER